MKTYNKLKNKGPTVILGDFNARAGKPLNTQESQIMGKYTFLHDKAKPTKEQNPVQENRDLFIKFCISKQLSITNTQYKKQNKGGKNARSRIN